MTDFERLTDEEQALVLQLQEITGKTQAPECIELLTYHSWNLEAAVNASLSGAEPRRPTDSTTHDPPVQLDPTGERRRSEVAQHQTIMAVSFRHLISFAWHTAVFFGDRLPPNVRTYLQRTVQWIFAFFGQRSQTTRRLDPTAGASRFLILFEEQYGRSHPEFFQETYSQAIQEAKRELKFLLVYLHSGEHDDTDSFCRSTLTSDSLRVFLRENNMIFWAGDISSSEGNQVSQTLNVAAYPFLCLLVLLNGRMTVVDRIEETISDVDLIVRLTTDIERFGTSLTASLAERAERDLERRLREQQDEAYRESLRRDEEKERRLREERERKRKEEEEIARKREERRREEEEKQMRRQKKVTEIEPEPNQGEPGIARILLRLPDGTRQERRFRGKDKVQAIFDFVDTKDLQIENDYVICTHFPRVELHDREITIEEAKLIPAATLFVEEKI